KKEERRGEKVERSVFSLRAIPLMLYGVTTMDLPQFQLAVHRRRRMHRCAVIRCDVQSLHSIHTASYSFESSRQAFLGRTSAPTNNARDHETIDRSIHIQNSDAQMTFLNETPS